MKKTIRGKVYDTEEMALVKKVTHGNFGDPAGYEESLYVAENGTYFLYVNGGEQSRTRKQLFEFASRSEQGCCLYFSPLFSPF